MVFVKLGNRHQRPADRLGGVAALQDHLLPSFDPIPNDALHSIRIFFLPTFSAPVRSGVHFCFVALLTSRICRLNRSVYRTLSM